MAYFKKGELKQFCNLIEGGWEPVFGEIKKKYFPKSTGYDTTQADYLTKLLIGRARRHFKKQGQYFYAIRNGDRRGMTYKLLTSSKERLEVTDNLWKLSKGFTDSTNSLILDTAKVYPRLSKRFLMEIQASFSIIGQLSTAVTLRLNEAIKSVDKDKEKEGDKS